MRLRVPQLLPQGIPLIGEESPATLLGPTQIDSLNTYYCVHLAEGLLLPPAGPDKIRQYSRAEENIATKCTM